VKVRVVAAEGQWPPCLSLTSTAVTTSAQPPSPNSCAGCGAWSLVWLGPQPTALTPAASLSLSLHSTGATYHAYGLRLRKAAVRYTSLYLGGAYVQSAPCCIRLYGSRHSRNLASLAPLHRAFCLPCHRQRRRTPCTILMLAMLTYNAAALPCT
jgi:hypothetical protein